MSTVEARLNQALEKEAVAGRGCKRTARVVIPRVCSSIRMLAAQLPKYSAIFSTNLKIAAPEHGVHGMSTSLYYVFIASYSVTLYQQTRPTKLMKSFFNSKLPPNFPGGK